MLWHRRLAMAFNRARSSACGCMGITAAREILDAVPGRKVQTAAALKHARSVDKRTGNVGPVRIGWRCHEQSTFKGWGALIRAQMSQTTQPPLAPGGTNQETKLQALPKPKIESPARGGAQILADQRSGLANTHHAGLAGGAVVARQGRTSLVRLQELQLLGQLCLGPFGRRSFRCLASALGFGRDLGLGIGIGL